MKPEEFEVYVIPPNFMEGGTLFGGLLKTRNTIEAVILGLAVGVPVLHLPFSLTVRVVILCLTALPLVLLALIGVSGMSLSAFILTQPDAHSYFLLDGSFPHFYYLTNDRYGEAILRLLCDTQQRRTLDAILADGLHEGIPNWRVENDAIDSEGNPVLFAYTCDFPRIRRFDTALELHGMTGTLICFDYQEEALREICGQRVILQSIDFQQFERSVLYS